MRNSSFVTAISLDGFYEGHGRKVDALPFDDAFMQYNLERPRPQHPAAALS